MAGAVREVLDQALASGNGILRLEPAWVARAFLGPGRRLGLPEDSYDVGERGFVTERWLASTTRADNRVGPPDEGLSRLGLDRPDAPTLADVVDADPAAILGQEYAASHEGLGRLAKIFDYSARLPLHLHHREQHAALVGRRSKDEAYYFPAGVDLGAHPETFLGLHPSIVDRRAHDVLLPYLVDWEGDGILQHSRGFQIVPEQGFHVQSGLLHAPGTALTIELQEDSDVFAMLQAETNGMRISKELLWKDVRDEDRARHRERFILELIDWEANGDPYLYERHHLVPRPVEGSQRAGGHEDWIFYGSRKFSGKRLVVEPGSAYETSDPGAYSLLVLTGSGAVGGEEVAGGEPGRDELLVVHDRAVRGVRVVNSGRSRLELVKFFGPDVNPDAPAIGR